MTSGEETELALARREYQSAIEDRRNGAISLATYFERLRRAEEVIERLAPEKIAAR